MFREVPVGVEVERLPLSVSILCKQEGGGMRLTRIRFACHFFYAIVQPIQIDNDWDLPMEGILNVIQEKSFLCSFSGSPMY
jgi:hypothetical protein